MINIRKVGLVKCVDFDPANQNTVAGPTTHYVNDGAQPTVAALKAAIAGSGVSASYPAAFMFTATKDDLIYVCRTNSIAVAGLPGA